MTDSPKPDIEAIQGEIIRRICFREAPPGTALKEAKLAQEFGVSRTPVRDAIARIKHLGLIETRNGVGTVVVGLKGEQIHQVYEMRLHLATQIGALSPRAITGADRDTAAALLGEAQALERDFSPRRYMELNHRLHLLITGLIGNALLQSFWQQTYFQAASVWHDMAAGFGTGAATALIRELQDLQAALEEGDLTAVGMVQRIHIGYGYRRIRAQLQAGLTWGQPHASDHRCLQEGFVAFNPLIRQR